MMFRIPRIRNTKHSGLFQAVDATRANSQSIAQLPFPETSCFGIAEIARNTKCF